MTPKQKLHRERFKKVMAEAKKMRAKNKSMTQAEAVKKAWANISGSDTKYRSKKRTSTTSVKSALSLAKKIAAKKQSRKRVGATALTKKGVPAKRLKKQQKEYNRDVDAYKYFVVADGKIQAGYEFKSDANDAASDFFPKAKVVTKQQMKKMNLSDPRGEWKYTLGGAHKDTKSHNVNIRVVSGVNDSYLQSLEKSIKRKENLEEIYKRNKAIPLKERTASNKIFLRDLPKLIKNEKQLIAQLKRYIK